jgi:hypothetical protein
MDGLEVFVLLGLWKFVEILIWVWNYLGIGAC